MGLFRTGDPKRDDVPETVKNDDWRKYMRGVARSFAESDPAQTDDLVDNWASARKNAAQS
jgi:hypothetical protein